MRVEMQGVVTIRLYGYIEIRLWFGTLHNTKNDLVSNQIVSLPKNHRMHIQLYKKTFMYKNKNKKMDLFTMDTLS
jgi:hypothetical protein